MLRSRILPRLLLALALLGPISAYPSPAAAQSFADDLTVTVVEVPVQVVRHGEPVRGLTRDDFVVYDRGVRRELVGFEVIDVLSPAAAEAVVPLEDWRMAVAPSAPPAGRHLLFLFDFQFAPRWRIERAVFGARGMIEKGLAENDRVSIAVYSGTAGANLLIGFTRDPEEIELALAFVDALADGRQKEIRRTRSRLAEYWGVRDGGSEGEAAATFRSLARRLGASAAVALAGVATGGDIMSIEEYNVLSGDTGGGARGGGSMAGLVGPRSIDDRATELEDLITQVKKFGESMAELATLLRDVPHPKQLVYFSEGFPTEVLTNVETQGRAMTRVRPAIRAMQAGGWAIQAIDLEGIPNSMAASGRSVTAFTDPAGTTFVTGGARGDVRSPTGQAGFDAEALAHLAHETGGLLIENFNNVEKAGRRILEATAVTYLLIFQPEDLVADGAFHSLEVKLASPIPGARLLHRTGYPAPGPKQKATETERRMDEARLVTGDETVLGLSAETLVVSPPVVTGAMGATARVSFLVDLAAGELASSASSGKLELELQAYAFGAADSLLDFLTHRVSLDLERVGERLRKGGLTLSGALDLPSGRHRVRLLVKDLGGGRVFARSHPVEVAAGGSAVALPPLLLDPVGEGLFLELREAEWERLGLPVQRLVPAAGPTVSPGGEVPLLFVFYPPPGARPRLSVRILAESNEEVDPADGAAVTWKERLPAAEDGSSRLVGVLEAGALAPGRYRLELTVSPGAGAGPLVSSGDFVVASG